LISFIIGVMIGLPYAHAMTAAQAYAKYQQSLARTQAENKKTLEKNTQVVIAYIEHAINYQITIARCSLNYNPNQDSDLLDYFNAKEVREYFEKRDYTVTNIEPDPQPTTSMVVRIDWCDQDSDVGKSK
jgi:hypothetical protein